MGSNPKMSRRRAKGSLESVQRHVAQWAPIDGAVSAQTCQQQNAARAKNLGLGFGFGFGFGHVYRAHATLPSEGNILPV